MEENQTPANVGDGGIIIIVVSILRAGMHGFDKRF